MRGFRTAVLFIFLCTTGVNLARAEAVVVRVRFLNGHTGKPIAHKSVVLIDKTNHLSLGIVKTDGAGYVDAKVDRLAKMSANVEKDFHQNCDRSTNGVYSVVAIASSGVTDMNGCGSAVPAASPGELVRIVRRSNLIESLREN